MQEQEWDKKYLEKENTTEKEKFFFVMIKEHKKNNQQYIKEAFKKEKDMKNKKDT